MEHSLSNIVSWLRKNTELVNHKITVKSFSSERTHFKSTFTKQRQSHGQNLAERDVKFLHRGEVQQVTWSRWTLAVQEYINGLQRKELYIVT